MARDHVPLNAAKEAASKDHKLLRLDPRNKLLRFLSIEAELNLSDKANYRAYYQHVSDMCFTHTLRFTSKLTHLFLVEKIQGQHDYSTNGNLLFLFLFPKVELECFHLT